MKTSLLLLAALSAPAFAQDDIIPAPYGKDRYAEMTKDSPFVLATKVEEAPAAKVDPFANIVLRGLGTDFVVIQRHGDDQTIRLVGDKEEGGFKVTKVNWSDVPGGTTVELVSNTGETGTVKFDENIRNATPPPPPPGGAPGMRRPVSGPQGLQVPPGANITVPRPPTVSGSGISQIPRPTLQPQAQPRQGFGGQSQQYGGRGMSAPQGGQQGGTNGYRQGGTTGGGSDGGGGRTRVRDIRNR